MSYISKITLPSGANYDIKDAEARDAIVSFNNEIKKAKEKKYKMPIYCWGDSLTEGIGGWMKMGKGTLPAANTPFDMPFGYPEWLGQNYEVINLGCRNVDNRAIMACQGADPITIATSFTIPASKNTPVEVVTMSQIYSLTEGTGLVNRTGNLVKINKEIESKGLNPCTIAGVEGILYRELGNDFLSNEQSFKIYFKRLEDGTQTTVSAGTEVQTFAMRYYRYNGAAIFWMGVNGGYSSVSEYISQLQSMIEFGGYGEKYLIIISREFNGNDLTTIKTAFTDSENNCHVLCLTEQLPYRGYALAGITFNSIDTSSWTTTDPIKLNAPLLCEYIQGNGESAYGTLHYSHWGYKAIAKLIEEKIQQLGWFEKDNTIGKDDYGQLRYRLKAPEVLDGSYYIDTKQKLFANLNDDWTFVIKWHGLVTPNSYPANIFCCALDGTWKGLLYRYHTSQAGSILFGQGAFNISTTMSYNMIDNWDGTNVVIIAKKGTMYSAYVNNSTMAYGYSFNFNLSSSEAPQIPLIIGGRYTEDGSSVNYLTAFTVDDIRIYNESLSDADCKRLYKELTTDESLPAAVEDMLDSLSLTTTGNTIYLSAGNKILSYIDYYAYAGSSGDGTNSSVKAEVLNLTSNSSVSIEEGSTSQITYSLSPSDVTEPVRFYSTDIPVCNVSSTGLITAANQGIAQIKVRCGGLIETVAVSVYKSINFGNDLYLSAYQFSYMDGTNSNYPYTIYHMISSPVNYLINDFINALDKYKIPNGQTVSINFKTGYENIGIRFNHIYIVKEIDNATLTLREMSDWNGISNVEILDHTTNIHDKTNENGRWDFWGQNSYTYTNNSGKDVYILFSAQDMGQNVYMNDSNPLEKAREVFNASVEMKISP